MGDPKKKGRKMGGKWGRGRKRHRDHGRLTEKVFHRHREAQRNKEIPRDQKDTLSDTKKEGVPVSVQIKWEMIFHNSPSYQGDPIHS